MMALKISTKQVSIIYIGNKSRPKKEAMATKFVYTHIYAKSSALGDLITTLSPSFPPSPSLLCNYIIGEEETGY